MKTEKQMAAAAAEFLTPLPVNTPVIEKMGGGYTFNLYFK